MTEQSGYRISASMIVRDKEGRILFVREADRRVHGKLDLPGGHLERGESIVECAVRELREETGLDVVLSGILGICQQEEGVVFVFLGRSNGSTADPGEDVLSCEWLTTDQIAEIPDSEIHRPLRLRRIVMDMLSGRRYPSDLIRNVEED